MWRKLLVLLLSAGLAHAAEWWVAADAQPGGDGSTARPFATVAAGLKAAKGGDTVTVRAGTYRESVQVTQSGTAAQPTVLRAAPGERAVLSGFVPLTGWQPRGDGIYTALTDAAVRDLFVGCAPQPVSWWPSADQPMRYVAEPGGQGFRDRDALAGQPALAPAAAAPGSLMAFVYYTALNGYGTTPVSALDLATGRLTFTPDAKPGPLKAPGDRYRLANHPALVRQPGQWACERLADKQFRVTFYPRRAEDLARTQVRRGRAPLSVGIWNARVAHVRVEGLEVAGSAEAGLQVNACDDVTVERCLLHHCDGNGLSVRRSNDVKLALNVVLCNGNGIGVASSTRAAVERNEVGLNMVDGLDIAGNVTGRPNGEPETDDVLVRRNYFHHHMLLGHPDNVQTYRGVRHLRIEDNVALWGGQGLMTEETEDVTLRNCVFFGTDANVIICGHGNSHRWSFEQSTLGFGGWGVIAFSGHDYKLARNVLVGNALPLVATVTSDYNLFWPSSPGDPVALTNAPKWQRFNDPAAAFAVTKQEEHSRRADPGFRAAPRLQAVAPWADGNRADRLALVWGGRNETSLFAVGDKLEVNGDGLLRRVTAIDGDGILFEPPLPARPFRDSIVWNWGQAASTDLDLRLRDGGPVGANLDIGAFQRGDFDGDGQRDLPELPEDLRAALPNPNAIVVPLYGH